MAAVTRAGRFKDAPAFEDLQRCVHCGYCICDCPTYLDLSCETESPRGRLHLISALTERRVRATPSLLAHLDRCVQCRACETACPSGVAFGRIMERGRALVLHGAAGSAPLSWRVRALVASLLLPHPGRLRFLAGLLRFYQRSGLQKLIRSTRLLRLLPGKLYEMEQFLPSIPDRVLAPVEVTRPGGDVPAHRVALLTGCVTPILYPNLHEATVRVLVRNDCEVLVPPKQTCCGALHVHAGDLDAARRLARRNIDAFLALSVEAVIVNAAGCGSTMKEYGELLKNDPEYAEKAGDVLGARQGRDGVPGRSAVQAWNGNRARAGDLPGLLPSCSRAGNQGAAARHSGGYPRPRICRVATLGPLLRQRRRLQSDATRDLLAASAGKDEARCCDQGRHRGDGKHRLHDAVGGRPAALRPQEDANGARRRVAGRGVPRPRPRSSSRRKASTRSSCSASGNAAIKRQAFLVRQLRSTVPPFRVVPGIPPSGRRTGSRRRCGADAGAL